MTKMATLEDAVSIAAQAHRGQEDKAGDPYLLHPLRMMLRMKSEAEMIAAVLHDVVEDSDWTLERLRDRGF
jgi:(p)ppGpp synthase/HD superfamily hydrolase